MVPVTAGLCVVCGHSRVVHERVRADHEFAAGAGDDTTAPDDLDCRLRDIEETPDLLGALAASIRAARGETT